LRRNKELRPLDLQNNLTALLDWNQTERIRNG
jgi:hypothetical protein